MKHSLKYILTGTAGFPNLPEFMAAGIVDEVEMAYCDSDRKKLETRTSWMEKVIKENVYVLKWYNSKCLGNQHHFRAQIQKLKKRFNQSDGMLQLFSFSCFSTFSGKPNHPHSQIIQIFNCKEL